MKKLILIILLFASPLMAQYSLKIMLPTTGLSSVIKFAKYPHNDLGADEVTGITVTEPGSAKTYLATGFTTYQYVTLWINGVKQTWFDSVQVGDITAYITTRLGSYVTLSTGQTVSGIKTFSNTTYFGGLVQQTGNYNFEMYKPQLHASSPWATYLTLTSLALIPKYIGDSDYVPKTWMFNAGSSKITLQSGYKLWGLGNTGPFAYNTSHFGWNTSTGLYLSNPPDINYDSLTVRVDTSISENPYYKMWSLKRTFWSQRDSLDLYWHYKNTYANTSDSFAAINKVHETDNGNNITLTSADQRLDSLYLGPGTYSIDFGVNYTFISASLGSDAATSDSIVVGLNKGTGVGNILKNNIMATRHYMEGANGPVLGVLSWKATIKLTADTWIYIVAKRSNTLNDYGHIINRQYILATRIN